jgi:hypothetical protein
MGLGFVAGYGTLFARLFCQVHFSQIGMSILPFGYSAKLTCVLHPLHQIPKSTVLSGYFAMLPIGLSKNKIGLPKLLPKKNRLPLTDFFFPPAGFLGLPPIKFGNLHIKLFFFLNL